MQAQQELVYPSSPDCALLLQGSQLAEQVRSAQGMAPPAFVKVRAPAVVDRDPAKVLPQEGLRLKGLLSSLAVQHQLGALGVGGHMQPLQLARDTHTGLVKVKYVALVQLGCYALAQGLGELNGLLQGQLEGALAEGGARELVE